MISINVYGCRKPGWIRNLFESDDDVYPIMEAVRSGGDLENIGGTESIQKQLYVRRLCNFRLTETTGNENFHKGGF